MTTRLYVDARAIARGEAMPVIANRNGIETRGSRAEIAGPSSIIYDPARPLGPVRCWVETEADVTMDDEENVTETAAPAEPQAAAQPSRTDAIVDRWFGDYSIPNFYLSAKDELKRRLKEEN